MKNKINIGQQEKVYKQKRESLLIRMFCCSSPVGLGLWMMLDQQPPEHARVEKVSAAFAKDIWGLE